MHRKHFHWRNLIWCLLQLSPIALTSSLAVDTALPNRVNALPVPQPATPIHSPVSSAAPPPSPESTPHQAQCLETTAAGEPRTTPEILRFAPLAPQFWGELEFQSPPKLGDLGGKNDLCVQGSLAEEGLEERSTEQDSHSKSDRTPHTPQGDCTTNQPQHHHPNPLSSGTSPSIETSYSATVGTSQQEVVVEAANLLGRGDSLSVGYIHTEESNDWALSYTLPLNDRDGTLSFAYAQSEYDPIKPPVEELETSKNSSEVEWVSRSYELTLRQPVIRSIQGESAEEPDRQPTVAEFALGLTAFLQESPAISLESPFSPSPPANNSELTRTVALRFFQEWKRQNARELIELRSQFSFGLNTFSSTINNSAAEVNQVPATTFVSWQGQAQWSRDLASDTLLLVRGNIQLTDRSLVPSEQFAIGGVQSVRGYLQDSLFSNNGIFASAELQLPILRVWGGKAVIQVVPFVDFGTVWNSSGQPNPSPNTLASVGLGLQWQQGNFTARLDWGIPLVSLNASDRTSQDNGLYFSVQYHP